GIQVELPGLRPQAVALSPGGDLLVTSGKTHELVVIDPARGSVLQRVPLPADEAKKPVSDVVSSHILEPDQEGQLSYTGLIFSPDGARIFLSNVKVSVKVFRVDAGRQVAALVSFDVPVAVARGCRE